MRERCISRRTVFLTCIPRSWSSERPTRGAAMLAQKDLRLWSMRSDMLKPLVFLPSLAFLDRLDGDARRISKKSLS